MILSLTLFLIGIFGFVLNRKNIILTLISSLNFNNTLGKIYATYIISIAGAESAIGLRILVTFYRLRGSIIAIVNGRQK